MLQSDIERMLIPRPTRTDPGDGMFLLSEGTRIIAPRELSSAASYLEQHLRPALGFPLPVVEMTDTADVQDAIVLSAQGGAPGLGDEGYGITVTPERVDIQAATPAGVFRGIQTFRQLVLDSVEADKPSPEEAVGGIPCVAIADRPRYPWRGVMLDCSRHFMSIEFIKRYLDLMAYLKMNRFHWHITDDPGWRLEIKRYPKLTEVGAFLDDDHLGEHKRCHGFYTHDDVEEIVAYARDRHIMVIPEIDMPGHSLCAMRSYPELCCTGRPEKNKGHQKDLYCAGNEATFEFVENVLSEVVELFPAPYVHIGGDEAPKDRWAECPKCQTRIKDEGLKDENELQSYFNQRIAGFLATKGRRLIGWEEILEGGARLPKDAIAQWWRHRTEGAAFAVKGARSGHDVIASPNSFCYLSFPESPDERFKAERTSDLRKVYSAEFTPDELSPEERQHILGGECCVWTEYLLEEGIDELVFPRILAVAELLWYCGEKEPFDAFHDRVRSHYPRLRDMGIEMRHDPRPAGL